jgi:hypothetical protein
VQVMRKSTCVHCVPVVRFIGHLGRGRWRPGWSCELDEWDPAIGCRKGQCHYYRRREKEEKEAKND